MKNVFVTMINKDKKLQNFLVITVKAIRDLSIANSMTAQCLTWSDAFEMSNIVFSPNHLKHATVVECVLLYVSNTTHLHPYLSLRSISTTK